MGQRQFDMENEQDVKDLFDILPSWVETIGPANDTNGMVVLGRHKMLVIDIINVIFGPLDSVARPVDKSKWIGCLCWFRDNKGHKEILGTLIKIKESHIYVMQYGRAEYEWQYCRPATREEIKFVEEM